MWNLQEVCITLLCLVEPSIYCFGNRYDEWIERDLITFVAYLNNVDVGKPLWRAEP
jgi:hypothetical protein